MSYFRHEQYFCTLFSFNFPYLCFICGDSLVPVAHVGNGWSSRRFKNVCEFFFLIFSRLYSLANAILVDRIVFVTFGIT